MRRILFVCTGNTCRSPMAESLLRKKADEKGLHLEVRSAGVSTLDGLPVSAYANEVLKQRNVLHDGSSRALTSEAIAWAELILTMTAGHKRQLLEKYPQALDKVHTLKEYVEMDAAVLSDIEELERLYSELHMKQALGGQLGDEERARLLRLEQRIPSFDIADPFGGSMQQYDYAANQIEQAIDKLIERL